jgi:hypothetical protein
MASKRDTLANRGLGGQATVIPGTLYNRQILSFTRITSTLNGGIDLTCREPVALGQGRDGTTPRLPLIIGQFAK